MLNWILEPLSDSDQKHFREQTLPTQSNHGFSFHKALDTSLLNLADDIAYGVHDFEDGVVLRLLTRDHWQEVTKHLDPKWAEDNNLLQIEKNFSNMVKTPGTTANKLLEHWFMHLLLLQN